MHPHSPLTVELTHFLHDSLPVRQPVMRIAHASLTIENDCSWNGCNSVGAGQFTADFAEEIQADNFGSSAEVFFNPIHDGLRYQAPRSRVREEIDDDGLPVVDDRIELVLRLELRGARTQKDEPDPDQHHKYD